MGSDSVTLIIIAACIVMSGYFSATETAFSSINRVRLKNQAEKGDKRAALVLKLSENYDSLLSTILVGNNIVNIGCSSLATILFVKLLGNTAGPGMSTLVTTIVVLIFGEISPKSIAKESPEHFAKFSAPIIRTLCVALTPVNWLFAQWKKLLSVVFKTGNRQGITQEELVTLVEEAQQEGSIDSGEGSLLRSALEFDDLEAGDILTPRIDIEGIPVTATQEEAARVFTETGFSRLPVYEENLDHIVGILYHKDFYNRVYGTGRKLMDVVRPAIFVTETKKVPELMQDLQKRKLHIAVVSDEFGGTVGIVTLEDILEELVGEIWDEHDEVMQEIVQCSEREYEIDGRTSVKKLFELWGGTPDTDVFTAGGWVMEQLRKIPTNGDSFVYDGMKFIVIQMDDKRISKVKLVLPKKSEDGEEKD
ncbi:MAG: hemolysin family protein [Eubacteriales bacterium]|nr:hemolysin family protein [Eubacteriales bacterium]